MTGQQLKNSILQEAIEGRLVPQNPNDEPASVLLERIRAEKARLVKEKKIKKEKNESRIYRTDDEHWMEHFEDKSREDVCIDEEIPFELPSGWEWCRVRELSESYIGLTYKPTDVSANGWIVLRSSNIQKGKLDLTDIVRVNMEIPEKLKIQKNDIIICARNGSKKLVGKSAIVDEVFEPLTFGAFMAICRTPYYLYMYHYLQSPLFFEQLRKDSDTTTINQLTQKNFNGYLVPLPPLAEQHRIVEKIESLLPKVEAYGKAQEELVKLTEALPDQLKKSILQEAIEGRLVPQDPNDEPASVLLERIRAEKNRLIKEKKIKKDKNESRIYCTEDGHWMEHFEDKNREDICIDEEIPFDIPDGWKWCRLGSIIKISSGDGLTSKEMDGGSIPVYGGNGITGYHSRFNIDKETVVIGRVGYYCGSVHVTPAKAWVTDNAFITEYPINFINRDFLVYSLKHMKLGRDNNATAQPVVSGKKIYPLLFPLPPLAEQHRIVEKIESLLPKIEKLKVNQ